MREGVFEHMKPIPTLNRQPVLMNAVQKVVSPHIQTQMETARGRGKARCQLVSVIVDGLLFPTNDLLLPKNQSNASSHHQICLNMVFLACFTI